MAKINRKKLSGVELTKHEEYLLAIQPHRVLAGTIKSISNYISSFFMSASKICERISNAYKV